jgi:hypothetical protein
VHGHFAGQQAPLRMALTIDSDQGVKQDHHAAALSPDGFVRSDVGGQATLQRSVGR